MMLKYLTKFEQSGKSIKPEVLKRFNQAAKKNFDELEVDEKFMEKVEMIKADADGDFQNFFAQWIDLSKACGSRNKMNGFFKKRDHLDEAIRKVKNMIAKKSFHAEGL
jgi:hypothetical protein